MGVVDVTPGGAASVGGLPTDAELSGMSAKEMAAASGDNATLWHFQFGGANLEVTCRKFFAS